jgi:hypothetical protein
VDDGLTGGGDTVLCMICVLLYCWFDPVLLLSLSDHDMLFVC